MSRSRTKTQNISFSQVIIMVVTGIAVILVSSALLGIHRIDGRIRTLETRLDHGIEKRLEHIEKLYGLASVFEEVRDSIIVPALVSTLTDSDPALRTSAAKALAYVGDTRAVEGLILALKDQTVEVRKYAIEGLSQIGDPRAIGPLEEVSRSDSDENVRKVAIASLRRLEAGRPPGRRFFASKHDFEEGVSGWQNEDYEDSRACAQVVLTDEQAVEGQYSLKMMMDLIGSDKEKSEGGAWVNMLEIGVRIPVNLLGRRVTAWIYAPWGARGKSDKPNGFQVFVRDTNGRIEYGSWYKVREAEWFQISLKVSPFAPRGGHMNRGFDPTQIIAIGVKMGAGGGSKEEYKGPVFVDDVSWE